ncbi:MAG: succinyl-diaminopimelate desuccinylase [Gammaproteobacteria bacterium]
MSRTLELTKELISKASITPQDEGCQDLISERLLKIGFKVERLDFGKVSNLWATIGTGEKTLVLVGHTDVVPTGPLEEWESDPFTGEERKGLLYGRGSADMKGSVAAFITACEDIISEKIKLKGNLAIMLTSDEEGPAIDGVKKIVQELKKRKIFIDWCLVGEPTSEDTLGDSIKIGRRGSVGASITIKGIQGHIAYPDKAENPIHKSMKALEKISSLSWEDKTGKFPNSVLQISNIISGTGAENVIPGDINFKINVRYSPSISANQIIEEVESILESENLSYKSDWKEYGKPFLTEKTELVNVVEESIKEELGLNFIKRSTEGGTSDGRFIAPTGSEVVELGPRNESIHKINESVKVEDLDKLSEIYKKIILKLIS